MLLFEEGELELMPVGDDKVSCFECGHRLASWRAHPLNSEEKQPYCGWCLMYGLSQWGFDNRDEIAWVGPMTRKMAEANMGKNTHVPELDIAHRLNWRDSERYVMGIVFTSRTLSVSFERIGIIQTKLERFYGD